MKNTRRVLLLFLSLALSYGMAQGYEYSDDFSTTAGNPNGVWSYGYLSNSGDGPFVAHNHTMPAGTGLALWETDGDPDSSGNINKAAGAEDHPEWGGMSWEAGMTSMMIPTDPAKWSAVVFTAPQAGQWNVSVDFQNRWMNGNGSNVFVRINGANVLLDQIDGFPGSSLGAPVVAPVSTDGWNAGYDGVATLNQGDTIMFGVYKWTEASHQVAIDASITPVPEPMILSLLALGGLMLRRKP